MIQFILVILAFSFLMGVLFSLIVQQAVWWAGLFFAAICLACSVAITEVKRRRGPSRRLAKQYREVFAGKVRASGGSESSANPFDLESN